MSLYYITKKTSATGCKFQAIFEKYDIAFSAQKALSKKYGFEEWRHAYWVIYGGISSVRKIKDLDTKVWKKVTEVDNESYSPKKSSKLGKIIHEDFKNLPVITIEELNNCIGFEEKMFKSIGVAFNNESYVGFITDEKWNITVPKDCEEVTLTKYNELFKITNPK